MKVRISSIPLMLDWIEKQGAFGSARLSYTALAETGSAIFMETAGQIVPWPPRYFPCCRKR